MSQFTSFFYQNQGIIRRQRAAINEALDEGPATAASIAEKTKIPKNEVVWNLLGMLRWGLVDVTDEHDHELVFSLKEV
jgi:DNA-binding IclR family transcriptional regulator